MVKRTRHTKPVKKSAMNAAAEVFETLAEGYEMSARLARSQAQGLQRLQEDRQRVLPTGLR
jgi:hypothetical protein